MFLDLWHECLNRHGEELCGDLARAVRHGDRTIAVLSDGLGSGVKANILATLTTNIILSMTRADLPLPDVIGTVIGTLPVCRVRKIAYSTFTIVEIDHRAGAFRIVNCDNPPPFHFRRGRALSMTGRSEEVAGKRILTYSGALQLGDVLLTASDGVLHAGIGVQYNLGWGHENISRFLEGVILRHPAGARTVVRELLKKTRELYGGQAGDDATCLAVYARARNSMMVFTGPPLDRAADAAVVQRFLAFAGFKAVCGGTTAKIVAGILGEPIHTELATLRDGVPPMASLRGVDLVTEGIVTLARALESVRAAEGNLWRLPVDRNGAALLAQELLRADAITFLVGRTVNPYYQNPLLPRSISIRRSVVEELAAFLREKHKEVVVEYC